MAGTIIPIVYGERGRGTWGLELLLHSVGALAGAAALGALLGAGGSLLSLNVLSTPSSPAALAALGCAHMMYAQAEMGLLRLPSPQSHWQVPRGWQRTLTSRGAALAYGAALGFGVLTRISASTFYVVSGSVVLTGSAWLGAAVMAGFGIGRVAPLWALSVAADDYPRVARWEFVLSRWQPAMKVLNGLALAGSAGWLVGLGIARAWS
jgi:sulfite exporter TauE/SafE